MQTKTGVSNIFGKHLTSMEIEPEPHFDDTQIAFSYKSNRQLKKANFIFTVVNHPTISSVATGLVKLGLALRLPINGLIRNTVFGHFCGGETIEDCERTIEVLGQHKVGTILDYSVEGEKTEIGFNQTCAAVLETFEEAKKSPHVPFCVFKVTGLADSELLTKIQTNEPLSQKETEAFEMVRSRIQRICQRASEQQIPVLIDAEETWLQDPIDQIASNMMALYNRKSAIVFTTLQLYRRDSLDKLKALHADAKQNGYYLGVKLVRGAYMEKERERSQTMNYPDPIQPDKESTDRDFNLALEYSIQNINDISVVCGSHNEYSNLYLTELLKKHSIEHRNKHVWFSQLLGMSDNISFNLANAGYNVAKYVPYGPVRSVMPYLLRRASENTSVAGQSSRELLMIRKEMKRRGL